MSRLQFSHGKTLHSWSGYGDGHLDKNHLIQELKYSTLFEDTRKNIINCDVLIIDETGMISALMLQCVEEICRNLRSEKKPFGGIQVIAAGSFLQLLPVPSANDKGQYAFELKNFRKLFPHKFNLQTVHRQHQMDLINAINSLCEGTPTDATHRLM